MLCVGRGDVYHNKSFKLLMKEKKTKSTLHAVFLKLYLQKVSMNYINYKINKPMFINGDGKWGKSIR